MCGGLSPFTRAHSSNERTRACRVRACVGRNNGGHEQHDAEAGLLHAAPARRQEGPADRLRPRRLRHLRPHRARLPRAGAVRRGDQGGPPQGRRAVPSPGGAPRRRPPGQALPPRQQRGRARHRGHRPGQPRGRGRQRRHDHKRRRPVPDATGGERWGGTAADKAHPLPVRRPRDRHHLPPLHRRRPLHEHLLHHVGDRCARGQGVGRPVAFPRPRDHRRATQHAGAGVRPPFHRVQGRRRQQRLQQVVPRRPHGQDQEPHRALRGRVRRRTQSPRRHPVQHVPVPPRARLEEDHGGAGAEAGGVHAGEGGRELQGQGQPSRTHGLLREHGAVGVPEATGPGPPELELRQRGRRHPRRRGAHRRRIHPVVRRLRGVGGRERGGARGDGGSGGHDALPGPGGGQLAGVQVPPDGPRHRTAVGVPDAGPAHRGAHDLRAVAHGQGRRRPLHGRGGASRRGLRADLLLLGLIARLVLCTTINVPRPLACRAWMHAGFR